MPSDPNPFRIGATSRMSSRLTVRKTRGGLRSAPLKPSITACHTSQGLATTTSPSADCTTRRPRMRSANKTASRETNFDIPSDSCRWDRLDFKGENCSKSILFNRVRGGMRILRHSRGRRASWRAEAAAASSLPLPTRCAANLNLRHLPLNTPAVATAAPVGGSHWTVVGRRPLQLRRVAGGG